MSYDNNRPDPSKSLATVRGVMGEYKGEFTASLPTHLKELSVGFMTSALSALRRDPFLLQMANENPASLITALSRAAQLGLMPGTEEFWLTPRPGRTPQVLGIIGYVGHIELMYRAGAVSSVIVELVRENDTFEYVIGKDDRPVHHVDHFGERGKIRGAYAYAIMKDGAVSKVVIVNQERIDRAMAASSTAGKSHSPWESDPGKMVLKTAAHDLAKWVPTSAEYIREQVKSGALGAGKTPAAVEPAKQAGTDTPPAQPDTAQDHTAPRVNTTTGEVIEDLGERDEPTNEPAYPESWGTPPQEEN